MIGERFVAGAVEMPVRSGERRRARAALRRGKNATPLPWTRVELKLIKKGREELLGAP